MGKKKELKSKNRELRYEIKDVIELAETVITINPYMKDKSIAEMTESILQSVKRAFNVGSWGVSTAGWFAYFDEWEEVVFVDFYLKSSMVHNKLFSKDKSILISHES